VCKLETRIRQTQNLVFTAIRSFSSTIIKYLSGLTRLRRESYSEVVRIFKTSFLQNVFDSTVIRLVLDMKFPHVFSTCMKSSDTIVSK
jgi:hypothetical protein